MDELGLKSKVRVKRKYNSYKGTVSHIAKNVLDREFTPDKLNSVWASDVTEFRVVGTKVYLSPIMDLYDRSIVSYSVSTSPNTAFTSQSLRENHRVKDYLCTRIKGFSTSIPAGAT